MIVLGDALRTGLQLKELIAQKLGISTEYLAISEWQDSDKIQLKAHVAVCLILVACFFAMFYFIRVFFLSVGM